MAVIQKQFNYMAFPQSFSRGNPIPLDKSAVWYDFAAMVEYAQSGATAYVGQVLAYVNETDNTAKAYIIADTNGTLTEVGAATLGDNKTIVLEEGTLALKNWGKEYYRWVDAVGEEGQEGYVAGHHEKQVVDGTHPWIAGLEPKAVAGEDGTFELAWYQPSTTTVEGLNSTVSTIRTTVEEITAALGDAETDGTIRGDIADLKTEVAKKIDAAGGTMTGDLTLADGSKAASETVVDTKIATAIGSAGHLKRLVVEQLPEVSAADVDTIYMVKDATVTTGDAYKEYMVIDGAFAQIGDTSVNLEPYATTADVEAKVKVVQDDLNEHKADAVAHITADERTAWNGKLDADNADYTTLVANKQKLVDIPAIKTIGSGLTLQEDGTLRTDISAMTGMMRFRGAVSTKPTTSTTVPSDNLGAWRAGDVVLYETAEYVVASLNTSSQPVWQLLGDEGAYQTKLSFTSTPSLTNKVVTNDTLTSNVNTLDGKITTAQNAASAAQISADNAKNVADAAQADATSALNRIDALDVTDTDSGFVTAVTQTDGKIAVTKKTLAASDVTDLLSFDGTYNASTNKIATTSTVTNAIDGLSSSVAAAVASGNQYSVLTGVTQSGGKLTAKTEVKLAAIAVTGNVNDLIQTGGDVLVIYGGTSTTVI